jgi:putative endonuclease
MESLVQGMRTLHPATQSPTAITGERGEEAAYFFLRRNGFIVVARRWRTGRLRGDLDLIAWEGDVLCFVEVKTRSRRDSISADFAVDRDKERILRGMATAYIGHLPVGLDRSKLKTRFDIVSVYLDELPQGIEVIRNAFA